MSRVAAAYRRVRALSSSQARSETANDPERWIPNQLPWELGEATDLRTDRLPTISIAQVAGGRRRSLGNARSAPHEQLAPLVDRILQTPAAEAPARSLLFTTIDPDPASVTVCATTGEVLARRTTKSVCIVDGNLRSPVLHRSFGLVSTRGLSDLLLDGGDARLCITKATVNLWLMPAGSRCDDALPCLAAEQIHQQLTQLLTLFDYVLLDTAPARLHNDAFVLGPCVDGVVLVIDGNATRREVAKRTAETLHAANARLFGAVLTNRSFPIPEGIYQRL